MPQLELVTTNKINIIYGDAYYVSARFRPQFWSTHTLFMGMDSETEDSTMHINSCQGYNMMHWDACQEVPSYGVASFCVPLSALSKHSRVYTYYFEFFERIMMVMFVL